MSFSRTSLGLVALLALGATAQARPRHASAHPDFSGLWSNASLTSAERPDDFKTLTVTEAQAKAYEAKHRGNPPEVPPGEDDVGGVQAEWWELDVPLARIRGLPRTSWIVSPADGQKPYTAAAKAANKANRARRKIDFSGPEARDADERCIADDAVGPPLDNGGYNDNYQFVQTPGQLAIYAEWMHSLRVVRIGAGVHPPPTVRLPMGDSIGRWEGDTLVIETTNFTPLEVAAPNGDPAADMRVMERLTRISPTEIFYAYSVTNPARFTQTWQAEALLHATRGPIYEYACHEGNYGLVNMLAGARRLEGRAVAEGAATR